MLGFRMSRVYKSWKQGFAEDFFLACREVYGFGACCRGSERARLGPKYVWPNFGVRTKGLQAKK